MAAEKRQLFPFEARSLQNKIGAMSEIAQAPVDSSSQALTATQAVAQPEKAPAAFNYLDFAQAVAGESALQKPPPSANDKDTTETSSDKFKDTRGAPAESSSSNDKGTTETLAEKVAQEKRTATASAPTENSASKHQGAQETSSQKISQEKAVDIAKDKATLESKVPDSETLIKISEGVARAITNAAANCSPRPRKRPAAKALLRKLGSHHFKGIAVPVNPRSKRAKIDVESDATETEEEPGSYDKNKTNTKPKATNSAAPKMAKQPSARKRKAASTALKKAKASPSKRAMTKAEPCFVGAPTEKLEGGWPEGWVKKVYIRMRGASKGSKDGYWFTPKNGYKLRSIVEVRKFLKALSSNGGDEAAAKKVFKSVSLK